MFRGVVIWLFLLSLAGAEPLPGKTPGEYFKVQYAGLIGFGSVGIGQTFFDRQYEGELFYGYLPKEVANVQIHTLTLKNNYIPCRYTKGSSEIAPYLGIGVMDMLKQRYVANAREEVPSDYYHITGVHLLLYAGVSYQRESRESSRSKALGFYMEAGTVDTYLVSYYNNRDFLKPEDIFSLAVGVRYHY